MSPELSERALSLLPRDGVDFVLATQPKAWLTQHHGTAVKERFLRRLASEIDRRVFDSTVAITDRRVLDR